MDAYTITVHNEEETAALAARLQQHLPQQATIVLTGTLGAGKTRFVKAFAAAAEIDPSQVTSPTFVLCQHYEGSRLIHHIDAYRLKSEDEFSEIGGEELQHDRAVTFIEWGERIAGALAPNRLNIHMEIHGEFERAITIRAMGPTLAPVVAKLCSEPGVDR